MSVESASAEIRARAAEFPVLIAEWSRDGVAHLLPTDGEYTCGRSDGSDVQITLPGVEERHCTLFLSRHILTVRREAGPVWVNDVPVGRERRLRFGDRLAVGPAIFRVDRFGTGPGLTGAVRAAGGAATSSAGLESDPEDGGDSAPLPREPLPLVDTEIMRIGAQRRLERHVHRIRQQLEARARIRLASGDGSEEDFYAALLDDDESLDELLLALDAESTGGASGLSPVGDSTARANVVGDGMFETELADGLSVSIRDAALRHQAEVLSGLRRQLERRSTELESRENEVQHSLASLHERWNAMRTSAAEIERHYRFQEEQARQLAERETELHRRTITLKNTLRQNTLRQRAASRPLQAEPAGSRTPHERDELERLQDDLDRRQAEQTEEQHRIEARRTVLTQLQQEVEQRRAAVSHDAECLRQREGELQARTDELAARLHTIRKFHRESTAAPRSESVAHELRPLDDGMAAELANLQERLQNEERLVAELNAAVAKLESDLCTQRTESDALRKTCEERQQQLLEAHEITADIARDRDALREAAQELRRTNQSLQTQLNESKVACDEAAELHVRLAELGEHSAQQTELVQWLEQNRDELARQLEDQQSRCEQLEHERAELGAVIADLRQQDGSALADSQARVDLLEQHVTELIEQAEQQSLRITELEEERQRLPDELVAPDLSALEATCADLQSALTALQSQHDEALESHRTLQDAQQQSVADLEQEVFSLTGRLAELNTELSERPPQSEVLNADVEELQNTLRTATDALHAVRSERDLIEQQYAAELEQIRRTLDALVLERDNALASLTTLQSERQAIAGEIVRLHAGTVSDADCATDPDAESLLRQIRELRDEMHDARERSNDSDSTDLEQIRELLVTVDERNRVIRELQEQLDARPEQRPDDTSARHSADAAELAALSRELDQRASLLDRRENELRERSVTVERSEEDLESQRRQLLEARQQLEIARTEIQLAMNNLSQEQNQQPPQRSSDSDTLETGSTTSPTSPADSGRERASRTIVVRPGVAADSQGKPDSAMSELKAELRSLFGIDRTELDAVDEVRDDCSATMALDRIDLSEPLGDSGDASPCPGVELHFGDASLLECDIAATQALSGAHEPDADAAVASYMEGLLSRARTSAGKHLPSELQAQMRSKSAPKQAAPQRDNQRSSDHSNSGTTKGAGEPVSFIEKYMAGAFGDLGMDGSSGAAKTQPLTPNAAESAQSMAVLEGAGLRTPGTPKPAPKLDLDKLRHDMNSFRTLSSQSVEHALAAHAQRQHKQTHSIRVAIGAFLVTLSGISLVTTVLGLTSYWLAIGALLCCLCIGVPLLLKEQKLTRAKNQAAAHSARHTAAHHPDAPNKSADVPSAAQPPTRDLSALSPVDSTAGDADVKTPSSADAVLTEHTVELPDNSGDTPAT